MCNLYSMTKGPAAIRELVKSMEQYADNLEPLPAIFPDQIAPVVMSHPIGTRSIVPMRWGFPPPLRKPGDKRPVAYVTNVRDATSSWWKPWLSKPVHRCLVPVTSFCEYDHRDGKAVPTWFALDESRPLFFFAGAWRGWEGTRGPKANPIIAHHIVYSFLTTEPNAVVAQVHPKAMPVILTDQKQLETWLTGSVEDALALQRPAPDTTLRIVARGLKEDEGPL